MLDAIQRKSVSLALLFLLPALAACRSEETAVSIDVPSGYVEVLEIELGDRLVSFGPFVGYYFKPVDSGDLSRLEFVSYNERSFYTRDLPENAKLFEGEAVLRKLGKTGFIVPADDRINPVLFKDAPPEWPADRPEPQDEFVHFHSCYDAQGSVLTGYWLRHRGTASFIYDMGGRVGPESVLYHKVSPGIDTDFARIMEFDKGPALQQVY